MRSSFTAGITMAAAVAVMLSAPGRVRADDERDETEVRVRAPLAGVDCTAQTIQLLGDPLSADPATAPLVVDISGARLDCNGGCEALIVGEMVDVRLEQGDAAPYKATRVQMEGEGHGDDLNTLARHDDEGGGDAARIQAPIQESSPTGGFIVLLGLQIDVSGAALDGARDDDDDENEEDQNEALDPSQLVPGQFVEVKLVSAVPPLVASKVEVKNFHNGTDCTVVDEDGDEVNDTDDTIEVQVTSRPKGASRKLRFTLRTNGHFVLRGLPTGSTKMVATRTNSGATSVGRKRVRIAPNKTRQVRIKLRGTH